MTSSTYLLREQGRSHNITIYQEKPEAWNKNYLCNVHVQFPSIFFLSLSIPPPSLPPDAHWRKWILYLRFPSRQHKATRLIKHELCEHLCSGSHILLRGVQEILTYFSTALDKICQWPRKIIEWLWLSSKSMHIMLSSVCDFRDFRRKKDRTFLPVSITLHFRPYRLDDLWYRHPSPSFHTWPGRGEL
jgi:hypothetical protein